MSQYFKCKLLQLYEEQGYIENIMSNEDFNDSTIDILYQTDFTEHSFGEIIVEKTSNIFIVKEIVTGIEISLLHCSYEEQEDESINTRIFSFKSKFHTFVRTLKRNINGIITEIGFTEPTSDELQKYFELHSDIQKYKKELLAYFEQGKTKMQNKIEREEKAREVAAEERRRLFNLRRQNH